MVAVRIHEHGNTDVIKIDEIDPPKHEADEVLVKIKTTALNHLDLWVRKGIPGVPLPIILGSDGAGEVIEVGMTADDFKPGDEVILAPMRSCGTCGFCMYGQENICSEFHIPGESTDGIQTELVSVPTRYLKKKPQHIDWEEAAAFPLVAVTAYQMLIHKAKLKTGDWVLIYGASSGVGGMAIQIARSRGARVITTAGTDEKIAKATALGAEFVLDYRTDPIGKKVREITDGRGVDIVFEHTGAKTWNDSLRALGRGGKLVTCGATTGPYVKLDLRPLFIKQQQLIGSTMGTLQDFRDVVELVAQNKIKPVIDGVFDYQNITEAHEWLESGGQFGKVIIRFD